MASCYLCESAEGVIEHKGKKICTRCFNFPLDIAFSLKKDLEVIKVVEKEAEKYEAKEKVDKKKTLSSMTKTGGDE